MIMHKGFDSCFQATEKQRNSEMRSGEELLEILSDSDVIISKRNKTKHLTRALRGSVAQSSWRMIRMTYVYD